MGYQTFGLARRGRRACPRDDGARLSAPDRVRHPGLVPNTGLAPAPVGVVESRAPRKTVSGFPGRGVADGGHVRGQVPVSGHDRARADASVSRPRGLACAWDDEKRHSGRRLAGLLLSPRKRASRQRAARHLGFVRSGSESLSDTGACFRAREERVWILLVVPRGGRRDSARALRPLTGVPAWVLRRAGVFGLVGMPGLCGYRRARTVRGP